MEEKTIEKLDILDVQESESEQFLRKAAEMLDKVNFGFNPQALEILDNPDSSAKEMEPIKDMIDREIFARLYKIAGSVYYGQLRRGLSKEKHHGFYDVVMALGIRQTKIMIILLALLSLSKEKKALLAFAKSVATGILARIIATQMGRKQEVISRVEISGLLIEVGKVIAYLFEQHEGCELSEEFIAENHFSLLYLLMKKFNLPDFLIETVQDVSGSKVFFGSDNFSSAGMVGLAYATVKESFYGHEKLILVSPMPDGQILTFSLGVLFQDLFQIIGLGEYLAIERILTEPQKIAEAKRA